MAAKRCCVGRRVAAVRHNPSRCPYKGFVRFEAHDTGFGSINKADLHALKRAARPMAFVEASERPVFPIDQRIENNENESCTFATLQEAHLPKLVSRELPAPAASDLGSRNAPVAS
jgi:hypothetical protein